MNAVHVHQFNCYFFSRSLTSVMFPVSNCVCRCVELDKKAGPINSLELKVCCVSLLDFFVSKESIFSQKSLAKLTDNLRAT